RDVATGQATGRRQHTPLTIIKEWGASTPQLFQALATNELLTVTISFPQSSGTPAAFNFYMKLDRAFITSVEQYVNFNATGHQAADDSALLEDVSFTFQ